MRTYGITGIALLLLAAAGQAASTVSTLTGKGTAQTQVGLVGPPGPWNEKMQDVPEQAVQILDPSEGMLLQPALELCPDPWLSTLDEAAPSLTLAVEDATGRRATRLIGGHDSNTGWGADRYWSTDLAKPSDPGFVIAGSGDGLPAFDDIDRVPGSQQTTRAAFVMEVIVFPALAAMVLVLLGRQLVLRVHRRRSGHRFEQLLQA
jgi:hypothetical protein